MTTLGFLRSLHKVFVHSSSRYSHQGCCSQHPEVTELVHSAKHIFVVSVVIMSRKQVPAFHSEGCCMALTSKLVDFIKSEILQPGRSVYPCFS
jgi:hypothetical protein